MQYFFDSNIAVKYGIEQAIVLQNLYFWIAKNKANNKNFYDGYYWTYNSQEAFTTLFPFWSRHKVGRIFKKLKDDGLVLTGNYNKLNYDRTTWYALTTKALSNFEQSIVQNCSIESAELHNRLCETAQPIPYINTYINTDNKHIYKDIIDYLNEKTDSNYKSTTKKNKSLIDARVNEGFTIEDFKKVIDIKTKEWINDANMSKFLRPETLFSNKFESYLNQKEVQNGISKQHDAKDTKFNGFKAKEFKGSREEFNDSEIL